MLDALIALPRLLLDPVFTTCLIVAVILAITYRNMRKAKTLTTGLAIAMIAIFVLTAGAVLFTVVMLFIFGPPPG